MSFFVVVAGLRRLLSQQNPSALQTTGANAVAPAPAPPPNSVSFPALSGGQAIIYALVVTAVILVALCLTIRALLLRVSGRRTSAGDLAAHNALQQQAQQSLSIGLNPAIAASFPMAPYDPKTVSAQAGEGEASCVVCLEDYREGDMLRHLPDCCHAFHQPCIDAWFTQHTTCPICRISLQGKSTDVDNPAQPLVAVPLPAGEHRVDVVHTPAGPPADANVSLLSSHNVGSLREGHGQGLPAGEETNVIDGEGLQRHRVGDLEQGR